MKTRNAPKILLAFITALALMVPVLTWTRTVSAQLTGAISTGTGDGSSVNGNIYVNCCDVYLNGGLPNCSSGGGLPEGDYYFQVTDPSGMTLLSSDPIEPNRRVTVSGGVITAYASMSGDCEHQIGLSPCTGAISVQLMPFAMTPNLGGEYKVWVTKVGDYSPGNGSFGFVSSNSKTDNFKCRERPNEPPQVAIGGVKYYDLNTNGELDPGEVGIEGWQIDVSFTLPDTTSGMVTTFTDSTGTWALVFPAGTTYRACEVLAGTGSSFFNWTQTGPNSGAMTADGNATADGTRCWVGTVGPNDTSDLNFGNVCLGTPGGRTLGFWSNKNGQALITSGDLQTLRDCCLRNANGTNFDPITNNQYKNWVLSATATNMAYMLSAQLSATKLSVAHGFTAPFVIVDGARTVAQEIVYANDLLCGSAPCVGYNGNSTAAGPCRTEQERVKNILDAINNGASFVQPTPCPVVYPE